jgi:DNA-directed RNA polymerase subunit RPC12/RpoP
MRGWSYETNTEDIPHKEWLSSSLEKLLDRAEIRCSSCLRRIPYSAFPEKARNFLEMELEQLKRLHVNPANAVVINKTGKSFDVGFMQLLKLAHSPGAKGIEITCGECGAKNQFRVTDEKDSVLQCLECGHFNKVIALGRGH